MLSCRGYACLILHVCDDRPRKRMLALLLQRIRLAEKLTLRDARRRNQVRDLRLSFRNRTSFVKRGELNFACVLERLGSLEEHAVPCSHAIAHHDRDGRCKTEGAGAGDDKDGDGPLEREGHVLSGEQPADENQRRNGDHGRHEHARHAVRDARDRRLGCRRVRDHLNDLGKGCVLSDARRLRPDEAGLIDRRRTDRIADSFVHRDGFAGQSGFIHCRLAVHDHTVHRNGLARSDHEDFTDFDLIDTDRDLAAAALHYRGLRRHFHQVLQRIRRAPLRQGFQRLADCNERRYHGR